METERDREPLLLEARPRPYELHDIGDLDLEEGGTIRGCKLAVAMHGTLNAAKDNAILVPTWYSGTSKIVEQAYIGEGRALDPDKYFIVVVSQIGNGLSSDGMAETRPDPSLTIEQKTEHPVNVESYRLGLPEMSAAPIPQSDADQLEAAADQAIAACGGDAREAVKALIVANQFLETDLEKLRAAVSTGYARGKLIEQTKTLPRDRKDWFD